MKITKNGKVEWDKKEIKELVEDLSLAGLVMFDSKRKNIMFTDKFEELYNGYDYGQDRQTLCTNIIVDAFELQKKTSQYQKKLISLSLLLNDLLILYVDEYKNLKRRKNDNRRVRSRE